MNTAPISIVSYPFGTAAARSRSRYAPHILQQVLETFFKEQGLIQDWHIADVPQHLSPQNFKRINHHDDVVVAVSSHGEQVADLELQHLKPITIGGDHSQGFSTIKGTIVAEVLKALQTGELRMNAELTQVSDLKTKLRTAINNHCIGLAVAALDVMIEHHILAAPDVQRVIDKVNVLWFDSHSDYNSIDTTGSFNFHGMALAAAAGENVEGIQFQLGKYLHIPRDNIFLLAARDIDEKEEVLLAERGIWDRAFPMNALRSVKYARKPTLENIVQFLLDDHPDQKWIMSLDVDGIDASEVPATGTPIGTGSDRFNRFGKSPAGPSAQDAFDAFARIAHDKRVLAIDISEASHATGKEFEPESDNGKTLRTAALFLNAVLGGDHEALQRYWDSEPVQQKIAELTARAIYNEKGNIWKREREDSTMHR